MVDELQGLELVEGECYYLVDNPQTGNPVLLIKEVDRVPPRSEVVILNKLVDTKNRLNINLVKTKGGKP